MGKSKCYQTAQVITPIKVHVFEVYLEGYDNALKQELLSGFRNGFRLNYVGPRQFREADNLASVAQNMETVNQKLSKEIHAGRMEGPFVEPPFKNLQVSPLGLIPKNVPNEFRLIHHLSYPDGTSINDGIPSELCSVQYQTIDDAISEILKAGRGAMLAKTDIESAFKLIPVHPDDHELLGIKFRGQFYFDKTLPMGASISCNLFEKFSTALHWIAKHKLHIASCVHVLDDFLFISPEEYPDHDNDGFIFVAPENSKCQEDLDKFLDFCREINTPIKVSKTVGPSPILTFLGIELDSIQFEARLPFDKVQKIRTLVTSFIPRKKVTLREIQSLIGLLNFACRVVVPGRAFLRRLIDLTKGIAKPHYRLRLTREARRDLIAWKSFIDTYNGKTIFLSTIWLTSEHLHLFTDASNIGFGAIFQNSWFCGRWHRTVLQCHISVRELFPIVLAVETWGSTFQNQCLCFHCDNISVVEVINKQTAKDAQLMILIRRLVLACLHYNILFKARHVPGVQNSVADMLSRFQVTEFKLDNPQAKEEPAIPIRDDWNIFETSEHY